MIKEIPNVTKLFKVMKLADDIRERNQKRIMPDTLISIMIEAATCFKYTDLEMITELKQMAFQNFDIVAETIGNELALQLLTI